MNVPRLRFKEFSGQWEEKALELLALVERGKFSIRPRNDPRYFGGSIPLFKLVILFLLDYTYCSGTKYF
jgi:hypothetical protein